MKFPTIKTRFFLSSSFQEKWGPNLTAMAMETTVLKRVVAYVSLVGGEPTAPSLIVLVAARTEVAVWMENVSASRGSPGRTVG